jgi:hypothetical protein
MQQPLRALTLYDQIPNGCIVHLVKDNDCEPHLHAGEFAVVDTSDTDPQHGEAYLVRFGGKRSYIQQVVARHHRWEERAFVGYWTVCLNFRPYRAGEVSHRSMADGPRQFDEMKMALIGRVVGFCPQGAHIDD